MSDFEAVPKRDLANLTSEAEAQSDANYAEITYGRAAVIERLMQLGIAFCAGLTLAGSVIFMVKEYQMAVVLHEMQKMRKELDEKEEELAKAKRKPVQPKKERHNVIVVPEEKPWVPAQPVKEEKENAAETALAFEKEGDEHLAATPPRKGHAFKLYVAASGILSGELGEGQVRPNRVELLEIKARVDLKIERLKDPDRFRPEKKQGMHGPEERPALAKSRIKRTPFEATHAALRERAVRMVG